MKEAVLGYLQDFMDQEALKRLYAKEDVSGIADARIITDKAFEQLSIDYGNKPKPKAPVNDAR